MMSGICFKYSTGQDVNHACWIWVVGPCEFITPCSIYVYVLKSS